MGRGGFHSNRKRGERPEEEKRRREERGVREVK